MKTVIKIFLGLAAILALVFVFLSPKIFNSSKSETPSPAASQLLVEAAKEEAVLPPASEPVEVNLVFGGDVMLSRVVGQKMVKHQDYAWPFVKVADILSQADLAIVNLESPFTLNSKSYFVPTGSFSFNADPKSVAGLRLAGIDLVSLANNHAKNQGERGLADSFKVLSDNGIKYVGAGQNLAEARRPQEVEIKGRKFVFLAYAYPNDSSVAAANRAGIASMDLTLAQAEIKKLKKQAATSTVIVLMHAGTEYTNLPNWQQQEFARGAIDAGVDLVVGHHPHWVQQTESYQGKKIIYSLGNLVFDQMWSPETQQGALAKVVFKEGKVTGLEFIPIHIYDYGQPQIVSDLSERQEILKRMGEN
ncbi:MAG: CapA family protein [Patescibacteria group bacterium]